MGLPWWLSWLKKKKKVCKVGDLGLIPGMGRSPGEGHDSILAWRMVHGVAKNQTQLSD